MAEPQIRYAKTEDGVNIAYATAGRGYPMFLLVPPGFRNVRSSWTMTPLIRSISQFAKVVWHDARGTGFSDREPIDFSLDALQRDIDAVANAACGDRFALVAGGDGGCVAIAYAVNHPERISHLVLGDAWTKPSDYVDLPGSQLERAIIGQDWQLYTETFLRVLFGLRDELAETRAAEWRSNITAEGWQQYQETVFAWDVTELLDRVQARALIVQNEHQAVVTAQTGPRIAASIHGARFLIVDDPAFERVGPLKEFVLGPPPVPGSAEAMLPSGTAIILVADIVDSTALTERMGDAAFRERARALDTALRGIIAEAGGTTIDEKTLGDGVLATFPAASQAIAAALRCEGAAEAERLQLHVGLHAGDVLREANNVFGGAVNIAARISGLSAPGEVLVSRTVADLARTSAGVTFEDRGEHQLKGVADPVRVYAVRAGGG